MAGSIAIKKMNWFSKTSAYDYAETWRQKRAAMSTQFQTEASNAMNAFATAAANQISGQAEIAGKMALTRIQAAATAKAASLGVDLNA